MTARRLANGPRHDGAVATLSERALCRVGMVFAFPVFGSMPAFHHTGTSPHRTARTSRTASAPSWLPRSRTAWTLFVGATLYDGASCVSSSAPVALYCLISSAMRATETYRPHIAFRPSRRHQLDTIRGS